MSGTSPLGWLYLGQYASTGVVPVITPVIPTGIGPGNGGELFDIQLSPSGTSVTATLAANLSSSSTLLLLSGDGSLPSTGGFVLTINSEVVYVTKIGSGKYRILSRSFSNTTAASHTSGTSATWNDTYDQAINASANINASFTADVASTGSATYQGFLIAFDSTQARLSGNRYPTHVKTVVGVFPAGTGSSGTNRMDASQGNKISTTETTSDNCPAALSNPSRISSNIAAGDVAIVRYQNAEASILTLTSRSTALQSWFGLERVDASNNDVTLTDPTGTIIDGTINAEFFDPAGGLTSVVLPGSSRTFTHGGSPSPPNFSDKGLPMCCLSVRQDKLRVPFWQSPTWHNFNYVYSGFGTDATYAQFLVDRNDAASDPTSILPGSEDIDGPKANWDDNRYYFGVSWYVAIYNTPLLIAGPSIGGTTPANVISGTGSPIVTVDFPVSGGSPVFTIPPSVEGGSGGNIPPPSGGKQRFDAQLI